MYTLEKRVEVWEKSDWYVPERLLAPITRHSTGLRRLENMEQYEIWDIERDAESKEAACPGN